MEFSGPVDMPLREIERAMEKSGMRVAGMVTGAGGRNFSDPDPTVQTACVEAYNQALEQVKALGGSTGLMYPGRVNAKSPYDVVYERMVKNTRKVIPTAEKTDVKVAFENVWNHFLLSPLEAARFVDRLKPTR